MVIISNEVDLLQLGGLHSQTGRSTRYFQYRRWRSMFNVRRMCGLCTGRSFCIERYVTAARKRKAAGPVGTCIFGIDLTLPGDLGARTPMCITERAGNPVRRRVQPDSNIC